jgi:hypothetical protein
MDQPFAGWGRDPYGRFEQRYHDGTRWTEHVFSGGVQSVDPWGGGPASTAVALAPPSPDVVHVPVPAMPPPSGWDPVRAPRFASIHGLAVALTWMLGGSVLALLTSIAAYVHRRSLMNRVHDGGTITRADASSADSFVGVAAVAEFLLGIAVLAVLIVLLYRASRNTELWERDSPRWAVGWTIGGWFIPCASYVIPFLVVGEIWRRTPLARSDGTAGRRAGATAVLWGWWISWVVGNLFFLGARGNGGGVDSLIEDDGLRIVASLLLAAASVLLVVVVRTLDRRQVVLGRTPRGTGPPPPS